MLSATAALRVTSPAAVRVAAPESEAAPGRVTLAPAESVPVPLMTVPGPVK